MPEKENWMAEYITILPKISEMKKKMIANNLSRAKATCPKCGTKDALKLSCAINYNQHIRAYCKACKFSMME